MNIHNDLIQKYNIPVPRYTSYPPANFFTNISPQTYQEAVICSNDTGNQRLSFYFHLPFCQQLCHYCGCNAYPMGKKDTVMRYIDALHREIDLLLPLLRKDRRISQIHYGGGSPTAISPRYLQELNQHLLSHFDTIDQPEIAIECHPGYLDAQGWQELIDAGFNRMSIGVQDFNLDVLKTANRRPSLLPMEEVFGILRDAGIDINLDFIYGLPLQTPHSFLQTIQKAIDLKPNRLVTFSYAHVPWVNKRQLILEKAGLPSAADKAVMEQQAAQCLQQAGYQRVGMDHFVLPQDELYVAQNEGLLHRNFQGYCTRRTTAQVYALGVTAISQLDNAYTQNTKDINTYIEEINQGRFTTIKGHILSSSQRMTREVIETLMCNYQIQWNDVAQRLNISMQELKAATIIHPDTLQAMQQDGIIEMTEHSLKVTHIGKPFVRTVAAALDPLIEPGAKHYSKPL